MSIGTQIHWVQLTVDLEQVHFLLREARECLCAHSRSFAEQYFGKTTQQADKMTWQVDKTTEQHGSCQPSTFSNNLLRRVGEEMIDDVIMHGTSCHYFVKKNTRKRCCWNCNIWGTFHLLVKISGISGSAVNGTRFVGSSHWKIPRKSGKSKKVGPFSRVEFPNGILCSIYTFLIVCTSSRSMVSATTYQGFRPNGTTFFQLEILLFSHRNFRVFFLNGKRPWPNRFTSH